MKSYLCRMIPLVALLSSALPAFSTDAPPLPAFPLPISTPDSAQYRWAQKTPLSVPAARVLDDMEQTNAWQHHGFGSVSLTSERSVSGRHSLRLESPTRGEKPGGEAGRPFGAATLVRRFEGEDWSQYNRLRVQVFPTAPGFYAASILVQLHNDGREKVPSGYGREGLNFVLLQPNEWNTVVWEITPLARDKVTGVELAYRLQGNEPEATNRVRFDFDQLILEKVEPDHFEGWSVAPGRIAYSHSGYRLDQPKQALIRPEAAATFQVLAADSKIVLDLPVVRARFPNTSEELGVLDFSQVRQPGRYRLRAGQMITAEFAIGPDVWRESALKTLNFFYTERCGDVIPGVHRLCHPDWRAEHQGKSIVINGGWHDAGDLSQGAVNTAESAAALLEWATAARRTDPVAAARFAQEAAWGVDWLLKTRFGDGARVTWGTMDFWTDGVMGTVDDVRGQVRNQPFENFLASAAEADAARWTREAGTQLEWAGRALDAAKADFEFASSKAAQPNLELAGAGGLAALALYKAAGGAAYASQAWRFASIIVDSQQRDPNGEIPWTGFFFTGPDRRRILHYFHRSHEQAPVVVLAELCRLFPEHPDWMRWYSAVVLYSEYIRRSAEFTAPYETFPASIYHADESTEPAFRAQVLNGVPLGGNYYLRRFPVWTAFRGNFGVLLSQAKAMSAAARLRGDASALRLAERQLQWVVGLNPFCQSTMFGEGHDFAPQYTAMSGDLAGSLPVGIQTRGEADVPYWPPANCYNYKEVWVHPSARWLSILADLRSTSVAPDQGQGRVELSAVSGAEVIVELKDFPADVQHAGLRAFNLKLEKETVTIERPGAAPRIRGERIDPKQLVIVVAVPNGEILRRREAVLRPVSE